jgi:hypothetical protein
MRRYGDRRYSMPKMKSESMTLLSDLATRLEQLVEVARQEGHDRALEEVRSLVGGGAMGVVKRGPGRPKGSKNAPKSATAAPAKAKKKRKNSWAGLSAEARLARVNAIRKGKGLPPKSAN